MTNLECNLENLAPELLLPILGYLPDIESLDSLMQASPAAYRAFNTQSASILKTVISAGHTHAYTVALIRITALVRTNSLPPAVNRISVFKQLLIHETTPHRPETPWWEGPTTSWPDLSTTMARELLAMYRRTQRLSMGCLEHYLKRFTPLRPFNSVEYTWDSSLVHNFEDRGEAIGAWIDKPPGTLFYHPIQDMGPPSWLEQQRVLRAFWRIQLFRELASAVDASRISWPNPEYWRDDLSPERLCEEPRWLLSDEEAACETLLEHELIRSAAAYMQGIKEPIDKTTYWQLKRGAHAVPSQIDWSHLDCTYTSDTWNMFIEFAGGPNYHKSSYSRDRLQHAKFELWRPLGFAIWSTARMAGYGLTISTTTDFARGGHYRPFTQAWRNLLTSVERDAIDKENQRRDIEMDS